MGFEASDTTAGRYVNDIAASVESAAYGAAKGAGGVFSMAQSAGVAGMGLLGKVAFAADSYVKDD